MISSRGIAPIVLAVLLSLAPLSVLFGQGFPEAAFQEMRWRMIGPLRGGRTRAVAGVPSQPNVFYMGAVNGGVWKTNDFGHTWEPIFDREPTGSIGAIAVAPSDPNIIYVASGEGLHRPDLSVGDGVYKSTDAGKTWTHLSLREGQQIPSIAIDPRDPNRLFAAVLGHPYGPNVERGIFLSTNGGQTFWKVLSKDENTGGSDVEIDPENPDVVYASLWEAREAPWENGQWAGTGGGLFKSTDGGASWQPLSNGLPDGIVQIDVAIAPSNSNRLYATLATQKELAIYRSDDAGENWYRATTDSRPAERIGGGDLPVPKVDPKNPDVVYVTSIVTWKSTDGGKTWTGFRGAPGGDDYQNIWINPNNPEMILLASDQGAIVTVNGGETWSSWYNQPTAQMYHVGTDNAFPYRVCGGQQESGSACVSSRGNWGEITERDWLPVGAEEYGYVTPDPLNPDIVYGGKLTRFDFRTGQAADILPKPLRAENFRVIRTEPAIFSPVDPHLLYFAANTLWQTRDAGQSWKGISPDLTRKTWKAPPSVWKYRDTPEAQSKQRGVIYALAPSPLDIKRLWAGTDDGLIWMTSDGGLKWNDVTPPQLTAWAKVSILDAGHFDAHTAYAAINTFRLDDLRPHIYWTHNDGKKWTEIVQGIPDGASANVVREDPKRKGLLFAGTEREVYVSYDDGDHWQSLRLNMPATSIRDLQVKGDDLIAATHGRGFWILDDITPLRQLTVEVTLSRAYLFRPQVATRVRGNVNTDTPLPPDVPASENPPAGAIIDYYLAVAASDPLTLDILDSSRKLVRHYSSTDPLPPDPKTDPKLQIPAYWVRPPQVLSTSLGMQRFLWDLHYPPVPGLPRNYPIAAVPHNTAPQPSSPWVLPGQYTVKLMLGGQSYTQPLIVKMDPRIKTLPASLTRQFTLSKQLYDSALTLSSALEELQRIRAQLQDLKQRAEQTAAGPSLAAMDKKADELEGAEVNPFEFAFRGTSGPDTLNSVRASLVALMNLIQSADVAPTAQLTAAVPDREKAVTQIMNRWTALKTRELPALDAQLKSANLPAINLEEGTEPRRGDRP